MWDAHTDEPVKLLLPPPVSAGNTRRAFTLILQPRCRRARARVAETSGVSLCAFSDAVANEGEQLLQRQKSIFIGG